MKLIHINIVSLGFEVQRFTFSLGTDFLKSHDGNNASAGTFDVFVDVTRRQSFIEALFYIKGTLKLVCDRSLKTFDYPLDIKKKIIFKYGQETKELTFDAILIDHKTTTLEVGQLIYEFIGLSIPIKKLHPDFCHENSKSLTDELVYSTSWKDQKLN